MRLITARNVNDALPQGLALLRATGIREDSRDGPVLRCPKPVTTVYSHPGEHVLFAPWRDANPFFMHTEALWFLAGRDDLDKLTPYVKRMALYSDDGGKTQPAAYGKRWRDHFIGVGDEHGHFPSFDQLNWIVKRLRTNPGDRRCVISMWDASHDPHLADQSSKDVPCNISVVPYISGGALHILVTCRSNDIIMGAYGANYVQMGILLEYLAGRIGVPVGTYTQVSVNYHAYLRDLEVQDWRVYDGSYESHHVEPYSMWTDWPLEAMLVMDTASAQDMARERIVQEDLRIFFEHGAVEAATKARWPYLRRVAVPLALAHQHWRTGRGEARYTGALEILERCAAPDWRLAAEQWVQRRYDRWKLKADDGVNYDGI